jgi:hypothetical protein
MSAAKYLRPRPMFVGILFMSVCMTLGASTALAVQATTSTTLAITSGGTEAASVTSGTVVTLTATVKAGATAVQLGQVNFCDATAAHCTDIHVLGTAQLTSAGTAELKFVPAPGSRSYKAEFAGTTADAASASSPSALTVTAATTTTIAQSGSVGNYTLQATVSGEGGPTAPTGTISFLDTSKGNAVLGTAELEPGTAGGLTWTNSQTPATEPGPQSIAVGDFNGDGIPDIAIGTDGTTTTSGIGYISLLLGNGDGTFQAAKNFAALPNNQTIAVAAFVDGGPEDVIAINNSASNTNNAIMLIGDGKGGGAIGTPFSLGVASASAIATGDFNGDGKQDFVVAGVTPTGSNPVLAVYLGNGNGTFATPTLLPISGGSITSVVVGDFSGNGKADLAEVNTDGTISVFLGDGVGDFSLGVGGSAGSSPSSMAVGDFNGDGKADLAVVNAGSDTVTILLSNGTQGAFTTAASPATGSTPSSIAVGDFSGDGIADLAVANSGGNTVTVLLGKGDGTFTAEANPATGIGPSSIAVGNFNGNGMVDLAVANADPANIKTGTLTVLLSQLTQTATATATGISPTGSGAHLVEASYPGDDGYAPSVSGTTSLTGESAGISVTPGSLTFASQLVNTASAAQVVTLTNSGTALLSITSISAPAPFAQTSTCGSSVAAGGKCTIAVTFDPTVTGSQTGALTITDNATGSPQTVALSGTGTAASAPAVTLSPTSLTFTAQATGSSSAVQTVMLTNSGSGALSISSIMASGDFAETNTCGSSLAAAANCTISVTFTPAAAGSRTGTLTITDNASGSSQSVALTGTGASVALSASSQSLNINSPGGSATDTIQISSAQGFTGTVNLTCAVTYKGTGTAKDAPTCTLNPATGQVSATSSLSSTLTVSTTGSGATAQLSQSQLNGIWLRSGASLAALFFIGFLPRRRWKGTTLLLFVALTAACATVGCGGSSTPTNQGTTTGSYQVVVTATSSTVTASTTIALTLQ